jgi:hypothetical protein
MNTSAEWYDQPMISRLPCALFCLPALVSACSCVERSQDTARSAAYAIFEGTVTDVHHFENEEQRKQYSRTLVTFRIAQSWKGPDGSSIQVHASERALMCDSYKFELGRRYIVYALQVDGEYGWADQYPPGTKILVIGDCILRVRQDVDTEAKLLGKARESSK